MQDDHQEWQQHYPTYSFKHRDVVLAEYEVAAKALEAEERLFANSANVTLLVAAGVGSLALGSLGRLYESSAGFLSPEAILGGLLALTATFSVLALRYFADRQKAILFAKRKMVVLRSMLGVSYGSLQLVLPSWRVEGATQPFALRLFPGWSSYVAYPFWIITVFTSTIVFFLVAFHLGSHSLPLLAATLAPEAVGAGVAAVWFVLCAALFRSALFDTHERWSLSTAKSLARVLNVKVVPDVEYVIYRSKLAVYELQRIKFDLLPFREILLLIEDRTFLSHHGVSLRGLARAFRDLKPGRRRSGGSTITQQLARSLFIVDYHKLLRRKLVEILLALWVERIFSKDEILAAYLAAVRFADKVYGVAAASVHFFGAGVSAVTCAQAFFLVERIGNIRSGILCARVDQLIRQATTACVLTQQDASDVIGIYEGAIARRLLTPADPERWEQLADRWRAGVDA